MRITTFIYPIFILISGLFSVARAQSGVNFWSYWGDGKAEVSTYEVDFSRYDQSRRSHDVLIFVTEDFNSEKQVKSDLEGPNILPVLKLNHVRRFQTGIYDYSMMLSVFSPISSGHSKNSKSRAVTPLKTSLVVTEWCGNYFEQFNSTPDGIERLHRSYFESEGDGLEVLPYDPDVIFEDDLLIRMRELNAAFPAGEYKIITSSFYGRLEKYTPELRQAFVTRTVRKSVNTVVGEIPVISYDVKIGDREYKADIQGNGSKKVLAWARSYTYSEGEKHTEKATLLESKRVPYWELQGSEGAKIRAQLDIPPILKTD